MSYTTILAEAYNYSEYVVKNLYYKGQGYTSNNQLKKNLITVAYEKNDSYSSNIEKMLQLIIRNPINEIFLKPLYSTYYPSNITQLIQMVNNDGYYLLFSETSLTIFLRSQISSQVNKANGKIFLQSLCHNLQSLPPEMMKNKKLFLSDIEDFHLTEFSEYSFINFFNFTENLIKYNIIMLLQNLEKFPQEVNNENLSSSLVTFKNLFLLKILEILNYGNLYQRKDFNDNLKNCCFYKPVIDSRINDNFQFQMELKRRIYHVTGKEVTRTTDSDSIINFSNPKLLIKSLGFNLQVFVDEFSDHHDNKLSNEEEEQFLQDFLNEICLNIFNSYFHDLCLILKVNEKHIIIDFDQINHIRSYPLQTIGIEIKNFLELFLNIANEQQIKQFLDSGSVRWSIMRDILLKLCEENSSFKLIVIQEGLEICESGHYFFLNSTAFEIFPKSNWFQPSIFSMNEIQLISVQGGTMRVVNYESLRIDDLSEMNDISVDLEILVHD